MKYLYNVYALNGTLIEKNKTHDYIKEEYGISDPDRAARHGRRVKGKYYIIAKEVK